VLAILCLKSVEDAVTRGGGRSTVELAICRPTGVYGDPRGRNWVDEDTASTPSTKRGRCPGHGRGAVLARRSLIVAACISFRLAGIYGPRAEPLAKVRAGNGAADHQGRGRLFSRHSHVEGPLPTLELSLPADPWRGLFSHNLVRRRPPAPPQDG